MRGYIKYNPRRSLRRSKKGRIKEGGGKSGGGGKQKNLRRTAERKQKGKGTTGAGKSGSCTLRSQTKNFRIVSFPPPPSFPSSLR